VVFTKGVTVGFARVEVNPAGFEYQLYVLPATAAAPMVVLVFKHIPLALPAMAAGNGLTVTFRMVGEAAVHPSTSVYDTLTVREPAAAHDTVMVGLPGVFPAVIVPPEETAQAYSDIPASVVYMCPVELAHIETGPVIMGTGCGTTVTE
jgi:hypothetical protein